MAGFGWVAMLLGGVGVALVATSCGDATSNPPAGVSGADDGAAAGAGTNASGSVTDGSVGAAGELGRRDGQLLLGQKCGQDADCGDDGLRCLNDNQDYMAGRGAPGGGICTLDCTDDESCHAFDKTAVCATLAEAPLISGYAQTTVPRLCMLGCKLGSPSGSAKCHGRADLACRPFGPPGASSCMKDEKCPADTFCFRGACREVACGPRCNGDADCNGARHCNPLSGLCDHDAAPPVPLGAACLGELEKISSCGSGNCLDVFADLDSPTGVHRTRVKEVCTQSCTLGTVCGNGAGACIAPRIENYALGDAGYCLQKCDCDGDCLNPADHCLAWDDEEIAVHYGSRGVCDYAPAGTPSLGCDGGQGGAGSSGPAGAGGDH